MRYGQSRRLIFLTVAVLGACAESPLGQLEHELDAAAAGWGVEDLGAAGGPVGANLPSGMDAAAETSSVGAEAATDAAADAASEAPTGGQTDDAGVLGLDASLADGAAESVEAAVPVETVPPSCEAPQRACGDRCVDTRSNAQHCGACGDRCGSEESCVQSRCLPVAPPGCTTELFEERAYFFCSDERTWSAARRSCLEHDMDLTVVGSAEENAFVRTAGAPVWLGASDQQDERRWRAVPPGDADDVSGVALSYAPWAEGEPNNSARCDGLSLGDRCLGDVSDEDCAMMLAEGRWNDAECNQRHRYVCEAY